MGYSKCLPQYRIRRDGSLEQVPGAVVTGEGPTLIVTNHRKRCVYVLNRTGGFVSDDIIQKDGPLLPMEQKGVAFGDLLGDLAFSQDGRTLYVSDDKTETLLKAPINTDGSIGAVTTLLEGASETVAERHAFSCPASRF